MSSNYQNKHQKVDSGVAASFDRLSISRNRESQAPNQATGGEALRLTALPNELLLKIAGYLRVDLPSMETEERFDGRERVTFVADAADLVNLSKTCIRLQPLAQEALLHTIVLGGFDGLDSIECLVRLLLSRPDLGKAVRRLRIGLPPNDTLSVQNKVWFSMPLGQLCNDLAMQIPGIIDQTPYDPTIKKFWKTQLRISYARPLCGVLLSLVQNLEHLSVSHSLGGVSPTRVLREMFGICLDETEADFSALPALTNLRYLNDATPADRRPLAWSVIISNK